MAKSSKKQIAALLEEAHSLVNRIRSIEAERDEQIAPYKAKYERAIKGVMDDAIKQTQPLNTRLSEIQGLIETSLRSGIGEDGSISIAQVVSDSGAEVLVTTQQQREIEPSAFFEAVAPNERGPKFYECLKVLIGKAEKFLPEARLQAIATVKRNFAVKFNYK